MAFFFDDGVSASSAGSASVTGFSTGVDSLATESSVGASVGTSVRASVGASAGVSVGTSVETSVCFSASSETAGLSSETVAASEGDSVTGVVGSDSAGVDCSSSTEAD